MDLFHDSMCALSVTRYGRLTLWSSPALASTRLKSPAKNSTPRSLCSSVPGAGWGDAVRRLAPGGSAGPSGLYPAYSNQWLALLGAA
jgi:hypothetical protein